MAICQIVENPEQSQEQAEQVLSHVRSSGPVPPEGACLMLAGPANPGWRVISVWDSEQARDQFFASGSPGLRGARPVHGQHCGCGCLTCTLSRRAI